MVYTLQTGKYNEYNIQIKHIQSKENVSDDKLKVYFPFKIAKENRK